MRTAAAAAACLVCAVDGDSPIPGVVNAAVGHPAVERHVTHQVEVNRVPAADAQREQY
jgi:hypothetical protein